MTGVPRSASGPLDVFKGPTSKGRDARGRKGERREERKRRKGGRGEKVKGRDRTEGILPNFCLD